MNIKEVRFKSHGDSRGQLIALETGPDVPFSIKRIYYIFDTVPGVRRGFHAHKNLKQILFCTSGACKIHFDDGRETCEVTLDSPEKGIIVSGVIWREMYDFKPGTVLMVLASELYDESDYIRNYKDFCTYIQKEKY